VTWVRLFQVVLLHNLLSIISVIFAIRQDLLSNFWFVHLLSVFSIRCVEKDEFLKIELRRLLP
jgi:hypothetical protein